MNVSINMEIYSSHFFKFIATNERRQYILVVLAHFMVVKHVIVALLAFQQNVVYEENVGMMLMAVFILEGCPLNTL